MGFDSNRFNSAGLEIELHVVHAQQGLELLDQGIPGLGENGLQGRRIEGLKHRTNRQPTNEFGDQAVAH